MAQDVLITPASTKIAFTDSGDTTTVLRTSSGRFEFKDSGESNFVDIYANDIVLDGNLTVGGTTTTVNTSNILIEDPILQLAKGQTSGSPTVDIGFVGLRGDSNNAAFIWDESADQFAAILTTGDGSSTTLTPASYAGFKAGASFFTGGITVENSLLRITSAAPNLVFSVPSGGLDSRIFNDGSGNFIIGHGDNSDTPTERLRINSSGSVGIGIASPGARLHVQGTESKFSAPSPTSDAHYLRLKYDNSEGIVDANRGNLKLQANSDIVYTSNKFGIGTNNPGQNLQIHQADSGVNYLEFTNTTATTGTLVGLNAAEEFILWHRHNSDMVFATNAVEKMRIENGGNVGIGTASPSTYLDVEFSDTTSYASGNGNSRGLDITNAATDNNTQFASLQLATLNNTNGTGSLVRIHAINENSTAGASSMAFTTRNASSTISEKMRIKGNGSVGIGTTSPAKTLHVVGTATIRPNGSANNQHYFTTSTVNNPQYLMYNSAGTLINRFATAADSYITGGNFGIGTASPFTNLTVYGATDSRIALVNSNTGTSSSDGFVLIAESDSDVHFLNREDSDMFFSTNGTKKMTILSSGNVGIGTTAPGSEVDIEGSHTATNTGAPYGANSTHINIKNTSDTDGNLAGVLFEGAVSSAYMGGMYMEMENHSSFHSKLHFATRNASSFGSKMVLTKEGNVGIGTTSPEDKLHVAGNIMITDTSPEITLETSNASHYNWQIAAQENVSGGLEFSLGSADADATNDTFSPKMVINSNGNVGIGTSSPSARLHVHSDGSHDEGAEIVLRHANNNTTDIVSTISFQNNGGGVAKIESGTTGANNTGYISFFTDNAGTSSEKMRILGNGNIGIGRSTAHGKLDIAAADLGSSSGDISVVGRSTSDVGSNSMYLLEEYVRTSAGSDWTSAGVRLQAKTDSTYQGYIQFNGDGNNYGISFGAGAGGTSSPGTTPEKMRIASTGNVSIGSNSSGYGRLFVDAATTAANTALAVRGRDASADYLALNVMNNADSGLFAIYNSGKAYVSGSVGIGTTSPSSKLHVNSAGSDFSLRLSSTASRAGIVIDHPSTTSIMGSALVLASDDTYRLGTASYYHVVMNQAGRTQLFGAGSVGLTVDTNQNVGIGTTSPTTPLHVVGNTVINGVLFFDSTSNSFINRDSSNIRIAGENGVKLQTYVSGWQDRLTVIDNGNVGIGTTSPTALLHVNGSIKVERSLVGISNSSLSRIEQIILDSNGEDQPVINYQLNNDLALLRVKGNTVTYGGLSSNPGDSETDRFFESNSYFGDIAASEISNASTGFTITLDSLPRNLSYTTRIGISFASAYWRCSYVKIEVYRAGAWTQIREETSNTKATVWQYYNTSSSSITKIRYTIKTPVTTSTRIVSLFAFNYNSTGNSGYFLSQAGGTVYGALTLGEFTFPTTDGTANQVLQTDGSGTLSWSSAGTGTISGSGTDNYIPRFNGTAALENSIVYDTGSTLSLGTTSPLTVGGTPVLHLGGQTNIITMSSSNSTNNSSYVRHQGNGHFQWQTYLSGSNAGILELEPYGGCVGVGTYGNAPNSKLFVANGELMVDYGSGGSNGGAAMRIATNSNMAFIQSNAYYDSGVKHARAMASSSIGFRTDATRGGDIVFDTSPSASADASMTLTERMVIKQAGNVGIGTTSPSAKLHIYETNSSNLSLYIPTGKTGFGTADTTALVNILGAGANNATSALRIRRQGGNELMRVYDDGMVTMGMISTANVGIGTATPAAKLEVAGNLNLETSGGDVGLWLHRTDAREYRLYVDSNGLLNLRDQDAGATRIAVKTDGNVGIGTAAPATTLNIKGAGYGNNTVGSADFLLEATGTVGPTATFKNASGDYGSLYFGDSASWIGQNAFGFVIHDAGSSADVKMVIKSDGNVGIGTTAPGYILDVRTASLGAMQVKGAETHGLLLGEAAYSQNNDYTGLKTSLMTGAQDYMIISGSTTDGNTYVGAKSGSNLHMRAGGNNSSNEIVVSASTGITYKSDVRHEFSTGSVGIGTASPAHKFHVLSTDHGAALIDNNRSSSAANLSEASTIYSLSLKNRNAGSYLNFSGSDAYTTIQALENSTTARNISLNPFGGYVGIGTASPTTRLHVNRQSGESWDGNIGLSMTGTMLGKIIVDNDGLKYRTIVSGDGHYFRNAANNTNLVIQDNGRVGIGTTSPATTLHSSGTIRVGTSPFTDYKTSQQYSSASYYVAMATGSFHVADSSNTAKFTFTPSTGKFGIGITSPNETADIVGSLKYGTSNDHEIVYHSTTATIAGDTLTTINWKNGTSTLDRNYTYKIEIYVNNDTSTNSSAVYVLRDTANYHTDTVAWSLRMVSRTGTASNHVAAVVTATSTVIQLKHFHPSSSYPIGYKVTANKRGSQNAVGAAIFGADSMWQRDVSNLQYPDGQVQVISGAVSAPSYSFTNDVDTGMSRPTTNALNFVTGGSERVRIDANGNFGIGVTPNTANKLEVNGQIRGTTAMFGDASLGNVAAKPVHIKVGGAAMLRLEDSTSSNLVYDISSDWGIGFVIRDETAGTNRLIIDQSTGNATFSNDVIVTGDLTVNGDTTTVNTTNLLVEDPLIVLAKNQSGTPTLDAGIVVERGDSNNAAMYWDESDDQFRFITTTETGSTAGNIAITDNADIKAKNATFTGTLTESSSITLKENIFDFTSPLEKISKVRPVKYNKKANKDKKEIGLIAEELAEIFPELVENDKDGNPASVNYTRAVTVLFDGFKQMYKELKEIKEKIK